MPVIIYKQSEWLKHGRIIAKASTANPMQSDLPAKNCIELAVNEAVDMFYGNQLADVLWEPWWPSRWTMTPHTHIRIRFLSKKAKDFFGVKTACDNLLQ